MSHSGSGQSVSEDSTDSQSGSTKRRKPDFGKKHRKIVRILTVIAYIISVSTAAVLLSAYYVFLWNPTKSNSRPTESSTTVAMASVQHPSAFVALPLNSFATSASQSFLFPSYKHPNNQKPRNSPLHHHEKHNQNHNHPVIPTPQSLILHTIHTLSTSTAPTSTTSTSTTSTTTPTPTTSTSTSTITTATTTTTATATTPTFSTTFTTISTTTPPPPSSSLSVLKETPLISSIPLFPAISNIQPTVAVTESSAEISNPSSVPVPAESQFPSTPSVDSSTNGANEINMIQNQSRQNQISKLIVSPSNSSHPSNNKSASAKAFQHRFQPSSSSSSSLKLTQ